MVEITQEDLELTVDQIRGDFGIELTWSEKVKLRQYMMSFAKSKKELEIDAIDESPSRFMLDHFGIDVIEVGRVFRETLVAGKVMPKFYGLDVLGTEEFKDYCRSRVEMWRDEAYDRI